MSIQTLDNPEVVLVGDVTVSFTGSAYGSGRQVMEYYRILEFCGNKTKVVKVKPNAARNGFLKTQCKPEYHFSNKEGRTVYREHPTK
jgi:hypothetical protein